LGFANDIDPSVKYTGSGDAPPGKYRDIARYAKSGDSTVSSILKSQLERVPVSEPIPSG